ncbi:PDZ domain-containing protein [Novosphingobium sp. FGD1]|uniref:PDZ domain-containing protein n=1 Tax=Novosphingobium silvae TaxID=2692619 RepID=A0A7X4GJI4_9SPHN|nr:PDZ domain-containing protein [Novosphingobium silvae]
MPRSIMKRTVRAGMALLAFVVTGVAFTPGRTASPSIDPAQSAARPWPVVVHAQMARLGSIEFALRRAAGDSCEERSAAIGVRIDSLQAYPPGDRGAVRQLTGLGDLPQVVAVAPGSPAARAGVQAGDEIAAVNGESVSAIEARIDEPSLIADALEEAIADTRSDAPLVLELRRAGKPWQAQPEPMHLCAARFILKTGEGLVAYSGGTDVAISDKLVEFARNDDELAVFAAHELAHVLAKDGKTRSLRERRAMEDRADILGVELMRCAGYDPVRGMDIWRRYNARDLLRWFRDGTHRNVPDRIARMTAHLGSSPGSCPPPVPQLPASI